jgi:hypothetical protein
MTNSLIGVIVAVDNLRRLAAIGEGGSSVAVALRDVLEIYKGGLTEEELAGLELYEASR